MYQKNKNLINLLSLGSVTFAVVLVFVFQVNSQDEIKFLLISLYLLILFTTSELFNWKAGVYAVSLSVWLMHKLEDSQGPL